MDRKYCKIIVNALISFIKIEFLLHFITWITYTKQIKKIQKIQNYAAKVIAHASKFDHVSPILKSLKWLNIENIITFRYCTIVYKGLNNAAPLYLSNLLQNYVLPCHLRSSNLNLLAIPDHNTAIERR